MKEYFDAGARIFQYMEQLTNTISFLICRIFTMAASKKYNIVADSKMAKVLNKIRSIKIMFILEIFLKSKQ